MIQERKYLEKITKKYEECLSKFGDSPLGVNWTRPEQVDIRYKVMTEIIKFDSDNTEKEYTLLDFGCGLSHLYNYIINNNIKNIKYSGLDISQKFIEISSAKYPDIQYYCLDILQDDNKIPNFDYIIINGVFTEKMSLSFDEMFSYFTNLLKKIFSKCNKGIAFNVMSSYVDWYRGDLFHLPIDTLTDFLTSELSRDFIIRNDYGLYEYTTYLYRRQHHEYQ